MNNKNIKTDFSLDGKDYNVKDPSSREIKIAQMEYNRAFSEILQSGGILRAKLQDCMTQQNVWSDDKNEKIKELAIIVNDVEIALKKGGIKLKEAVALAKKSKAARQDLQALLQQRAISDSNTAEGQAENAKFQRLLTLCLVYKDTGKPVFNSIQELLEEKDEVRVKVANQAFDILGKIYYKFDDEYETQLPENVFLKEYGFIDDKLRYINENKQLVDDEGRLVNEDGNWIDDAGNLVDINGNIIPETSKIVTQPFLDDEGKPIIKS